MGDGVLSHLISFLSGAFMGASGKYLADRFTDQRRRQEASRESKKRFHTVRQQMPDLIDEMHQDLNEPGNESMRHFVISPTESVRLNVRAFVYYEDRHPDLRDKATILENHGFIFEETTGKLPRYRMTEEFVGLLRSG